MSGSWLDLIMTSPISSFDIALAAVALKGAVVLAAGAAVSFAVRSRSAATRHLVWAFALGGALALPLIGGVVPRWRVPLLPAVAVEPIDVFPVAAVARPAIDVIAARPVVPARVAIVSIGAPQAVAAALPNVEVESAIAIPGGTGVALQTIVVNAAPPLGDVTMIDRWQAIGARLIGRTDALFAIWLGGALLVLLPVALAHIRLRRLSRRARPLDAEPWGALAREVCDDLDLRRPVLFLESDRAAMPMTWGILHPVVLLPANAWGWSEERRRDVLRHELAHVERRDCLTQLIAQLACALHWFDPLVWLAAHRLRVEREHACDDRVLDAGARPSEYAECLLDVARSARARPAGAFAALAMARRTKLSERLFALLDTDRRREPVTMATAARAVAVTLGLLFPLAAFAPAPRTAIPPLGSPVVAGIAPTEGGVASTRAPAHAVVRGAPHGGVAGGVEDGPFALAASGALLRDGPLTLQAVATTAARLPLVLQSAVGLLAVGPCDERGKGSSSTNWSSSSHDGKRKSWTVRWKSGDCTFEVQSEGEITFAPDLTDIATVSDGGYFELEERISGDTRRLVVRPRGGSLERTYFVNGEKRPYDDAARAWFAERLISLDRKTAFAVEQRLPLLLKQGGPDAVLQEVAHMESDYARRQYLQALLATRRLDAEHVKAVIQMAGRDISSDYELAELLIASAKLDVFDSRSHAAFVGAVRSIQSDYERRRALTALLTRDPLSKDVVAALLKEAAEIRSDYEKAELLIAVSKRYAIDEETRPIYIDAVGSITSDYEHRRVLSTITSGGGLNAATTKSLLANAKRIKSDYELAEFLRTVTKVGTIDSSNLTEYFAAVGSIESDYEHHRALTAVLQRRPLTRDLVREVLRSARSIGSDYECASALAETASAFTIDGDLRDEYEKTASTIGSEYEYGRALSALRRASRN